MRCHIYGKKNCEGPEGWENDDNAPWYDPDGHYGGEIEGAIKRGYTAKELKEYFNKIMSFAQYAFNKSHAACYSYITILTAWLKTYYPAQFMAATISMADEEHRVKYMQNCEQQMGISIAVPNINESGERFTPFDGSILYGFGAIKGVGAAAIPEIMARRPYLSVEDAIIRIPKKAFNKRVGEALIKSGAFDFENTNRYELLNEFNKVRAGYYTLGYNSTEEAKEHLEEWIEKHKDIVPEENIKEIKKAFNRRKMPEYEILDPEKWNEKTCIEMEKETLGAPVTYKPWWDTVKPDEYVEGVAKIKNVKEHTDKRGNLMAFLELEMNDCKVDGVVFAAKYCRFAGLLDPKFNKYVQIRGKKDSKGGLIVNRVEPLQEENAA